jgi:hypothetical protein
MRHRPLPFKVALLFCSLLLAGNAAAVAQEKAVAEIKRLYEEVGRRIELSERGGDESQYAGIVCNELVFNRNRHVWPAVGNYQATYKFYYDSAQTEEHHYPDRLRKIVMKSSMSDRSYYEEYFFDEASALIFYYSKPYEPPIGDVPPRVEQRIYFAAGRPIRIVTGEKTHDRFNAQDAALARKVLATGRQLKAFFAKSLTLPDG